MSCVSPVFNESGGLDLSGGVLATGRLPRCGSPYICRILTPLDTPAVHALQDAVWQNLSPAQKNFILPQSPAALEGLLSRRTGFLVGVLSAQGLQAQGAVYWTKGKDPAASKMTDCPVWMGPPEQTCVLMGTLVHPNMRGNGMQKIMHQARLKLALQETRPFAMGEVALLNTHSWPKALAMGGYITSAGVDATDGCQLLNYTIAQGWTPCLTSAPAVRIPLRMRFEEIAAHLNTGRAVGVALGQAGGEDALEIRTHTGWVPSSTVARHSPKASQREMRL